MKNFTKKFDFADYFADAGAEEAVSTESRIIFFLIAAVLIFSVVVFGAVDAWALGFLSVIMSAIAVFWLVEAWRKKEFRFNSSSLQIPLLGLILIGLVQLLPLRNFDNAGGLLNIPAAAALSLDAYSTRLFVMQLIVWGIFFAAALTFINSQKRLRKIILTIIIFGAIMAFFGILQRLASSSAIYGLRPTPQAIPFASFVNQHHFAALMNMIIGLTFGLLFGKATKKDKKPLLIIASFLMLIAIILTGSRGGILSFLAIAGFFLLPKLLFRKSANENEETGDKKGLQSKFALIAGIVALGVFLLGTILFLGGDKSLLRGIGFGTETDISNGRSHFWTVALQIFLDYPILGAGLNAFGAAFSNYDTWNGIYRIEQAHNDYLQILADAGIVGFACVAWFIYLLFKKGLPNINSESDGYRRSAATGALAGCFGILVHSFFDFPLRTPANAFFFLTLAAIATVVLSEKESGTEGEKRRRGERERKSNS